MVQCIVRKGGIEIAARHDAYGDRNAIDCMMNTGAPRVRLAAPPVDGAVTILTDIGKRDTRVLIATPLSVVTAKMCAAYEHT